VVDIVDSHPDEGGAVNAYQVTWQEKHPFTMTALCRLHGLLNIDSERKLKIFFVVHADEILLREFRQGPLDQSEQGGLEQHIYLRLTAPYWLEGSN
jgi:hypothetical protein